MASLGNTVLARVLLSSMATLGLTACMHTEMPALNADIPTNWNHSATSQIAQNSQPWWHSLNDALLNNIAQTALTQNLSLQQASERIMYARALQQQELASEKPQLSFYAGPNNLSRALASNGAGSGQSNQSQLVSSGAYLAGFDLFWELPLFGQQSGQRQITQAELQISEADLSLKQISLISEIIRVYAELTAAVQRDKQLEMTGTYYLNLKTYSAKGVDHGLFAPDVIESITENMHATQRLRRQNHIQQEIALQRLAVLCGLNAPMNTWLQELQSRADLPLSDTDKSLALPITLPADIIRTRPDIKIAESRVLRATGALGIAKADLYPKLSIEGALMAAGRITAEKLRHTGAVRYIAPSIRIPLLDWGLRREVVNQRESQLREALLAYKEAVLLAIEETENAIVTFNESRAQLIVDSTEVSRRQEKLTKLRSATESGYLSKVDLLKHDIKNQEASLHYIDSRLAWMQSFAYANKALSGTFNATAKQEN